MPEQIVKLGFYIGYSDSCQGDSGGPFYQFKGKSRYNALFLKALWLDLSAFFQMEEWSKLDLSPGEVTGKEDVPSLMLQEYIRIFFHSWNGFMRHQRLAVANSSNAMVNLSEMFFIVLFIFLKPWISQGYQTAVHIVKTNSSISQ